MTSTRSTARGATRFCWGVGVFLFIFSPVVNVGLGSYGDMLSALCALAVCCLLIASIAGPVKVPREIVDLSFLLMVVIAYGMIASIAFSSRPGISQVAIRPVRVLIMFAGVSVFVMLYARALKEDFADNLVQDMFVAIGCHAVLMVFQFVVPSLRDAIYPYTFADQALEYNQQFRMAGLTNGGGAQLSIFQSAGLMLWPMVLLREQRVWRRLLVNVLALCMVASIILSGRSGVVLALTAVPFLVLLSYRDRPARALRTKHLLEVLAVAAVASASILAILRPQSIEDLGFAGAAINRSLDFFLSEGGITNREDANELFTEQYFMPDNLKTFVFGDPFLFDASYWMEARIINSDSGYISLLFGYGVIGSALQYSFYLLLIFYAWRNRKVHAPLARFSLMWAVTMLVFQIKEPVLFARIGLSLTTMSLAALAILRASAAERSIDRRAPIWGFLGRSQ